MTHPNAAYQSYKSTQHEGESLRESEARALLSCASRLQRACEPDCSNEDYSEAVRLNQQLWTIFQAALVEPEHVMARDLRTLLLNLCRYIDKTSLRALAEAPAPRLLRSLIDINRNIAAGLSVKKPTSEMETANPAITHSAAAMATSIMTTV